MCYPEPLKITLTIDNQIITEPTSSYSRPRANTKAARNIKKVIDSDNTNTLYFLSNLGQIYKLKGHELPRSSVSCGDLFSLDSGERIIEVLNYNNEQYLFTCAANGYGKKTLISEFETRRKKAGVGCIKLDDGIELVGCGLCNDDDKVALMSSLGKGFIAKISELTPTGRTTKGRKLINVKDGLLKYSGIVHTGDTEVMLDKERSIEGIKECGFGLMGNKI